MKRQPAWLKKLPVEDREKAEKFIEALRARANRLESELKAVKSELRKQWGWQ